MTERTFPLDGVTMTEVPDGTVLQQDTRRFVVTDETIVFVDGGCFVTARNFERIAGAIGRGRKAGG